MNDHLLSGAGFGASPDVYVDGERLAMARGTDGNWYAYFADIDMAAYADGTTTVCGIGLDFGDMATYDGLAINNGCMNVVKDSDLMNGIAKIPIAFAGTGITADDYPVVQLLDFAVATDFDVVYDDGLDRQSVTLVFDTVEDYAGLTLDRGSYLPGAQVHVAIVDTWLNIDPTEDDIWTFATAPGHEALYYDLFSVENMEQLESISFTHDELVDNLMCDDNCILLLDPDTQGTGNVVTLQNTLDTRRSNNDDGLGSSDRQDPYSWTVFFDDWIDTITLIPAGAIPITFIEDSPGVFVTTDHDNNSNLVMAGGAKLGSSATIDYNDSATSILAGHGFASIDIALNDDEWNSGEAVTVTIADADANRNGLVDETMEISDPLAAIPALSTGNPFTIGDDTTYRVTGLNLGDTDAKRLVTSWPADIGAVAVQVENHGGEYFSHSVTAYGYDEFSAIGIIDMDRSMPVGYLHIDYGRTIGDLTNIVVDDAKIFNFFNYDFRSLEGRDAYGISFDYLVAFIDDEPDLGIISVDLVTDSCEVNLDTSRSTRGYVHLDDDTVRAIHTCAEDDEVSIRVSFDTWADAFDRTYVVFAPDTLVSVAADFMSFGYIDDGVQGSERVANQIVRIEAEETGDDTGIFEGTLEFVMVNQLNVLDVNTYEINTSGDGPTFVVMENLAGEDSPRVSYSDLGAGGVVTRVSDQEEAPTHTGVVSFDSNKYKVADTVTITLEDADLNVDSDIIDIYTVVTDRESAIFGQVGEDLGVEETFGHLGRLLGVTFDDSLWASPGPSDRCWPSGDKGLDDTGFTLIETGRDSGVFTGTFQIPADWCEDGAYNEPRTTTGLDIEVNYLDFRDASGEIIEVGYSAAVGAHTGSVSFDRTVYPVPFGEPRDFDGQPSRKSYFPIHSTGLDGTGGLDYIASGDLIIHVRVTDPDFDTSAVGQDSIAVSVEGTDNTGPVKISVIRGSETVTLGFAGGPVADDNYIYDGIPTIRDSDDVRQFGPIWEIAGVAGVFEADITIRYTDGPADTSCPVTTNYSKLDGSDGNAVAADRFGPDGVIGNFCILRGDVLLVEYNDPTDSSGYPNTVTDAATFDLRNAVLLSDRSEYPIGADMILTLIEPDFDLDNDRAETYDLDLIEWDSGAATITLGDRGGNAAAFDPEPTAFRETGDSTGIFQAIIKIPEELDGDRLVVGEAITLEYTDWGPAGADFVGQRDEDVTLDIVASDFATIELDQTVPPLEGRTTAMVINAEGSSVPGCEETNECFIPHTVTIDVGGEVIWGNVDLAAHTVTSGVLTVGGPDGVFDSGLLSPGVDFSHKFEEAGVYPYFCLVHLWMVGTVIVGGGDGGSAPIDAGAPNTLGGDVVVRYEETSDPGYYGLRSWLMDNEDKVIDAGTITDYLVLPYDIRVDFALCGQSNAYYYPGSGRITICYELVDEYTNLFREILDDGESRAFNVANALNWVFMHELGHAVIDIYDLPVTGQEENVADQFATIMMLRNDESGHLSVWAMAAVYASGAQDLSPFWDTHALDAQRFYNMVCLLYGKHHDDEIGETTLDLLPEERAVYCPGEYDTAVRSWGILLADHVRG